MECIISLFYIFGRRKKFMVSAGLMLILIFAAAALLCPETVEAFGSWEWQSFESDNFIIFFPQDYENQARELTYYLEKHAPEIEDLTGNQIDDRIVLTLEDTGLLTNGFADPINTRIGIFTNNPDAFSGLASYESWLRMVGIHELTHILHMNNVSGGSELTTAIFGNALSPNIHSPLWLIEGIAVYAESQISGHEGRLSGGQYDAILSQKAALNKMPSISEMTYNHNYFPAGHQYLYGAAFFRYLAEEYGEEKFARFFDEYGSYFWAAGPSNFLPLIGPDRAAERVFGQNFTELHREWKEYEEEKNADWSHDGRKILTAENGHIRDLQAYRENLYYFKSARYPSAPFNYHSRNELVRYHPGEGEEVLMETAAGSSGTMEFKNGRIYFLLNEREKNFENISQMGRGLVSKLHSFDPETGEIEQFFEDEIRDFVFWGEEEEKILYARASKNGFGSELILTDKERENREVIGTIPLLISEFHLRDGEILASAAGGESAWNIIHLEDPHTASWSPLVASPWSEKHIFTAENNVYFTSSYEGYEGIYSYDEKKDDFQKLTEGGHAKKGVMLGDELYYLSYAEDGMAVLKKEFTEEDHSGNYSPPKSQLDRKEIVGDFSQRDVSVEETNFWRENFRQLIPPSVRFPPLFAGGQDATGMNTYAFNFNPRGIIDAEIITNFFQPLQLRLSSRSGEEGRSNTIKANYPLYVSGPDGLTDLNLEMQTDFSDIKLGTAAGFRYPSDNFILRLQGGIMERSFSGEFSYTRLFNSGRFSLQGKYTSDIEISPGLRATHLESEDGYHIGGEYIRRLFSIRKGSWNPNLFLGDLYGGVFLNYYSLSEEDISGGLELQMETGAANSFYFVPRLGLTFSEQSIRPYLGIEVSF